MARKPVRDINSMTPQEILEHVRSMGTPSTVASAVLCKTYEDFFNKHDIVQRCPACGSPHKVKNGTNDSGITRYKCKNCGKRYSLTTNTIFEGMDLSVSEMVKLIMYLLSFSSIENMHKKIKSDVVNKNTVWLLIHKAMAIIADMPKPKLSGIIQIDEKYLREAQKGQNDLISLLDPSTSRNPRDDGQPSECGIFGPEFVNVLCAVDENKHYWAKCVCMGPMVLDDLLNIHDFLNTTYVCSDNLSLYDEWCRIKGYAHYVEPSTYKEERKARGYIKPNHLYNNITEQELKNNERIDRMMYAEGRYPRITNTDRKLSFDEFMSIKNENSLGLHRVNGFHSVIEGYITRGCRNISLEYVEDYIALITFVLNYKTDHNISSFSERDAEDILAKMVKHTIIHRNVPTREELKARTFRHLRRPNGNTVYHARRGIKKARTVLVEANGGGTYEGDSNVMSMVLNKQKFFKEIGTIRLNELCKLHGINTKGIPKKQKIQALSSLVNSDEIMLNEIAVFMYGDAAQMTAALNQLPQKRKRGRPKKKP